jgi:DNA-binding transcriptional regulator LsrR (DeoR family)
MADCDMPSRDLLRRVAKMSFEDGLTNQQIAQRLCAEKIFKSPNTKRVTALLQEAGQWLLQSRKTLDYLEDPLTAFRFPTESVLAAYPFIRDVRVVTPWDQGAQPTSADLRDLDRRLGHVAASYLDELAADAELEGRDLHIAISGGNQILDVVNALPERRRDNVHFYPAAIVGRVRNVHSSHVGAEINAGIAWARSGKRPGRLHYSTISPPEKQGSSMADGALKHKKVCEAITEDLSYLATQQPTRQDLADIGDADVFLMGLGPVASPENADSAIELLRPLGVSPELLAEDEAIAELAYCFLDSRGQSKKDWALFLTPGCPEGLKFYRERVSEKRKVVLVVGPNQTDQLRAALRGKLVNVIITDSETFYSVLENSPFNPDYGT